MIETLLDALGPWRSPALGLVLTAAAAAMLARIVPSLAGLAAGIGLVAALFDVFGVMMVTPRMLPERLPWLALAAAALGLAVVPVRERETARTGILTAAILVAGWWMVGAPRHLPDLVRVAVPFLIALVAFLLTLAPWRAPEGAGPVLRMISGAVVLLVGLALTDGPVLLAGLAACIAAAGFGVLAGAMAGRQSVLGDPALLPLGGTLAATALVVLLGSPETMTRAVSVLALLVAAFLPVGRVIRS